MNLAKEYSKKYPHLSEDTHLNIVQAGFGNYISKEAFKSWYDELAPLLTPEMVSTDEDIHAILRHDSFMVYEAWYKPLYEILTEKGS